MRRILILATRTFFLVAGILSVTGQAMSQQLSIGDIQIIGYRADADDAIAFVTWKDIAANTSVFFTDSGFFSDGTMRDSENTMSWSHNSLISAGTVISITSPNAPAASTANIGSISGALDGLAAGGDQIFVGLAAFPNAGDTTSPGSSYTSTDLLYGFDFNGTVGWDTDATSPGTSALPAALNVPFGNMSVAHFDNGQYTGPKEGLTIEEFRLRIADAANWTFNNDGAVFGSLNSQGFTAVPEPSSMALLSLVGLGGFVARRFRKGRVG